MKVDIHTHILPKTWPDLRKRYGYGGWLEIKHDQNNQTANLYRDNGDFFRAIDANCWNIESRLIDMEASHVDMQVLSTVPVMFNYWARSEDTLDFCRFLNDDIAASVMKHPNKFIGLGTIPLQDPVLCVEELKRLKTTKGMHGIQIGTHIGDEDFNTTRFDPVFKTCEDLGLSIFIHPWDMDNSARYRKFWLPWLVGMPSDTTASMVSMLMGGVLLKYPNLRICFAHGGGSFPYTFGRIEHGYNVRPDLCSNQCNQPPSAFLGKFYTDSLVHNNDALDLLVKVIGENKVCMGSDYPFPLGEHYPGSVIERSRFSKNTKENLLSENAKKFLQLS